MSERPTAQCPHCQSVFYLDNSQLGTGEGKVRCGNCLEAFTINITRSISEQSNTDDSPLPSIAPGSLTDSQWASGITINPLEEQPEGRASQASKPATIFLLLLLIPVQWIWFNSCDLYRHETLHNWIKWLPAPLSCNLAPQIDLAYLGLRHTKVASRQDATDALGVDTILSNNANYKINYPALKLAFFSDTGSTVAQRVFCPREYLSGEAFGQSEIPRRSDVHLAFSIIDPGLVANRYQLSIVQNSCQSK